MRQRFMRVIPESMRTKAGLRIRSIVVVFLLTSLVCSAQVADRYILFSPNNNSMWFGTNGKEGADPSDRQGWEWPAGSGINVAYVMGMLWIGIIDGSPRAGGTTYHPGLQAGCILSNGHAADSSHPTARMYRIAREDAASGSNPDYRDWPISYGAPADTFGKPLFLGDEQLWFVSNDLDSVRTSHYGSSTPIGLEIQTTVWGFRRHDFTDDAVFVRHLILNKGSHDLADAYVSVFSDFELGGANDDYCGVDTLRLLQYQYNGSETDRVYHFPPAIGQVFLQTPAVDSPGDSVQVNGRIRRNSAYCPVSGFLPILNGGADPIYRDPDFTHPAGLPQYYDIARGRMWNGNPFVDPTNGRFARMAFAGDPVRGKGWIDGIIHSPNDRITMFSAGPFQLAKGDTQEVVYAYIARQGRDRIHSLDKLWEYSDLIRTFYRHQKHLGTSPVCEVSIEYPDSRTYRLTLAVTDSNAVAGEVVLVDFSDSIVARIPVHDDGLHGDGAAGDHHYGADWTAETRRGGVDVFFDMQDSDGFTYRLHGGRRIPTAGSVRIAGATVVSDHLNQDGAANPGENIRFVLDVRNDTRFPLGRIDCERMDGTLPTGDTYAITDTTAPGATGRRNYDTGDQDRYLVIDVPDTLQPGEACTIRVRIRDEAYNEWHDSTVIPVAASTNPSSDSLIAHVAGPATGTLGMRLLRPAEWDGRMYRVTIRDSLRYGYFESRTLTVTDLLDSTVRADRLPLPDQYAHDMPTIDGFRLTIGTADRSLTYREDQTWANVPPVTRTYTPPEHYWLKSNTEWVPGNLFFGSALTPFDLFPVRLEFSTILQQSAYVYLRGGSPYYTCLGFGSVPFRAYDISDSVHPRQINVAFVEQAGGGQQEKTWNPVAVLDREYLFLFRSTYTGIPDSFYTLKRIYADADQMDIVYSSWYYRMNPSAWFTEGDTWTLTPTIPISPLDTFIVNIKGKTTPVTRLPMPKQYALARNHPNPFSAATTIDFEVPRYGRVRLTVLDALGRVVDEPVDADLIAGHHTHVWNAGDLPSGMYVVRLEAGPIILHRTMVLVR